MGWISRTIPRFLFGGEIFIQKEAARGMRYWGICGPYVKRNQLLGFVEQIGHDVESIESILEHGVEEDAGIAEEANMTGLAVISDEVVRRLQENDGYDYEEDQDENMEDQDEDTEVINNWNDGSLPLVIKVDTGPPTANS
jgi:hypothetical protein